MATHVKVIAVFYGLTAALLLAGAVFAPLLLGLFAAFVGSTGEEGAATGATLLGLTGVALSVLLGALAIPFLATAWGLIKLRPWARIAGIVLGALCLPKFPLGTALGIYALVVLFRKDTEALFAASAGSARL